jgi:hypothetical protein
MSQGPIFSASTTRMLIVDAGGFSREVLLWAPGR